MLSGLLRRTTDPGEVSTELADYATSITTHCPYLRPSWDQGRTTWNVYQSGVAAEPGSIPGLAAQLFAACVPAVETVRRHRRDGSRLVCENVCLLWNAPDELHRRLLDEVHWVLKCLFTPVGIMVGKFWRGEQDIDRYGRTIPVPPITFLSLRGAVLSRDPRFLSRTPAQAARLITSDDDGRDVLSSTAAPPGETNRFTPARLASLWPALRAWSMRLIPDEHPGADPTRLIS